MPAKKTPRNPWPTPAETLRTQAILDVLAQRLAALKAAQSTSA